jgi:hypothetical protein
MKTKTATKTNTSSLETDQKARAAKQRSTRLLIALSCVGLSAIAVVPFFFMGESETGGGAFELRMPTTHDMFLQWDQMKSFYNGLAAGEIYPRWEEDTNRGFGAPTTSYYPPGIYYVTSLCYAIARDWVRALLDAHLLMMIAAAAGLYFYARQSMGRSAAVVAMAAYIFLPYHLADQYQRGALAELLGFVWMPLMLLFGERLMKAEQAGDDKGFKQRSTLLGIAGLAASYGAFLWSHPPTAYQFTLAFGVYVLMLSVIRREWKGLILVGVAMAIGLGLSAAYLISAAIEQNLIHKEFIAATWPYHKTYVFVHDLYNSDVHSGFFKLVDWIWITGTATIAVAAITLLWLKRRVLSSAPALKQRVLLWVTMGGLASFMMTKLSMPIGKLIPKIDIGVFTWRMLAITTLIVALLTGAFVQVAIEAARRGLRNERLMFRSIAALILIAGAGMSVFAVARPTSRMPVFEPEAEHLNWATLPSAAPDPGELPDDVPQAELAEDNGDVRVEEWKPQHRVIRAEVTDDDVLLVRTFNFPGWTARVDGQPSPINTSEELADMEVELHAGTHLVTLDFLDTPQRRACRLVTLGSTCLLILCVGAPLVSRLRKSAKVSV